MNSESSRDLLRRASSIRLAIFDIDGVLTDGRLHYTEQGETIKVFHSRDGLGLKALKSAGIEVAIISGRTAEATKTRLRDLGIEHAWLGCKDKIAAFNELIALTGLQNSQASFMGDDWVDWPVMQRCGLAATVADADIQLQERAHFISQKNGGYGAARELCELLLQAQNKLQHIHGRPELDS